MHLLIPTTQLIVFAIGALVPIATYILNHFAPWADEKVKGIVTIVVAALSAGLYQALDAGHLGFNNTTLQLVLTAIFAALTAHHLFYKPSTISTALGGGRNHPRS